MDTDKLDKEFGVTKIIENEEMQLSLFKDNPTKLVPISGAIIPHESGNKLENDFETARSSFKELLEKGQEALAEIIFIAGETNTPRAYEVAFQGMKNIGELGEKLIDIHKKKKDAYEHEIDSGVNIENMNAVFIGSLADLQKQLGDKRNAHHSNDNTESGDDPMD